MMRADADQTIGLLMLTGSAIAYSTAGFFTRLIPLDVWTLLFWRGIFAGLLIAGLVVWQHRGGTWMAVRGIGWTGLLVAALSTVSSVLYLAAFRHTSVADVTVVYATAPFLTAALSWLILRERPGSRVLAASLAASLGVVAMVGGGIGRGHIAGDLLAFGMTLGMALTMILMRRGRRVSMLPAVCLSSFLTALAAWPFTSSQPVGGGRMVELVAFGITQLGVGLILLTLGTRRASATQAALIGALDAPLAPLWVWLAFAETPSWSTLAGGGVVMAAVLWNIAGARRPAPLRQACADRA